MTQFESIYRFKSFSNSGESGGRANYMDPLCTSLVHQYLKSTNSALTDQFKTKYQPTETNVRLFQVFLGVDLRRLPSVLSGSAFVQALKNTRSKLQAVVDLERERK